MTYRCPECRTRRTSLAALVRHVAQCPRPTCDCMGSGLGYPHRPGSVPCCDHHPRAALHRVLRASAGDELQVLADWCWEMPGAAGGAEAPF